MAAIRQEHAPGAHVSEGYPSEHVVQFYETDDFLLDSVTEFVSSGLARGDACIVIATPAHRTALEQRLASDDMDVLAAARAGGTYIARDAHETLSTFMVDGAPAPERFSAIISNTIARAAAGGRRVRVFGEMVALLWAEGNHAAAIRLEELWNDLHDRQVHFSLFCGYPMRSFEGEAYEAPFAAICQQHSQVIPDESYSALTSPDERLAAISILQQKARSLEAEIAERKAAEERLRISENRYRRLFEASTDGILIVDPDTAVIADANPVMTNLLGYPHEQLLGQSLWHIGLFPDWEATSEALQELRENRALHREMLQLRAKGGQVRYVELMCNRFRANGHDVIQCNLRDITERNAFISMASHELKTPVTSLKAFTQILQRRLRHQADPNSQTLIFLDRMETQLNKLASLISDLLDVSKMQTGVLAFRETDVDLDELVRETIENVQAATTTHRLRLKGETHAQVHGDRDRLEQVLINLLTNAIKYSPQADTVIVRLSSDHDHVEVAVQDFGIGIAEQYHERIFDRFYQITDRRGSTYPGLGIGLYIARTLIERHGGRLCLESRAGAGSTFRFTLPLARRESDAFQPIQPSDILSDVPPKAAP